MLVAWRIHEAVEEVSELLRINRYQKARPRNKLVRPSQIVQSVMYSYDAVISSYIIPAIHSWFFKSARDFDDDT